MTAYLVTGGAGFIGSHLVDALVKPENPVRVVDNLSTGSLANLERARGQVELLEGDLHDLALVRRACKGIDIVFHLASGPAEDCNQPAKFVPATDTLHVLIAAKENGVRRVVYASCASVYGPGANAGRIKESVPTTPATSHGIAKLIGEQHCVAFTSMYGLDTVRLRYFNVFGPRQPSGQPGTIVLELLQTMLAGGRPSLAQEASQAAWDLMYVGDVVYANLLAAELSRGAGKVFNIGHGRPTTLLDLVSALNTVLGTRIAPRYEPHPAPRFHPWIADVTLGEMHLGLCASTDLEHALRGCLAAGGGRKPHPAEAVFKPNGSSSSAAAEPSFSPTQREAADLSVDL
jgi:UDP-glucose 4-epimerase